MSRWTPQPAQSESIITCATTCFTTYFATCSELPALLLYCFTAFRWTPQPAQSEYHYVCFEAIDAPALETDGSQFTSQFTCFTFTNGKMVLSLLSLIALPV